MNTASAPATSTVAGLAWTPLPSAGEEYSVVLTVPIVLADSSGLLHVLEHVLCHTEVAGLGALSSLQGTFSGLHFNARTEVDNISLHLTARCEPSFRTGLELMLRACFSSSPCAALFEQQNFHLLASDTQAPVELGGAVYNEMRETYGSARRQLDAGTAWAIAPDRAWHFDPGGDPLLLRRLKFSQLQHAWSRTLVPERCFLLTRHSGNVDVRALIEDIMTRGVGRATAPQEVPLLASQGDPARPAVIHRSVLAPHHYLAPESDAASYRRWVLDLGAPSDPVAVVRGWVLNFLFKTFSGAFDAFAGRSQWQFEPELSSTLSLGPRLVSAFTLSTTGGAAPPQGTEVLLAALIAKLDGMDLSECLEQHQIALKEDLFLDGHRVPTALLLHARARLDQTHFMPESLNQTVDDVVQRCLTEGVIATLFDGVPSPSAWTAVSCEPVQVSPTLSVRSESRFRRRIARLALKPPAARLPPAPSQPARTTRHQALHTPWRLDTGGVMYEHAILDVSHLQGEALTALPLLLLWMNQDALEKQAGLQSFLFSQFVSASSASRLVSFKRKKLVRRGSGGAPLIDMIRDALTRCRTGSPDAPALVETARRNLLANPELFALSESASPVHAATDCVRTWRGWEQLRFLDDAARRENACLNESLPSLAMSLAERPAVTWALSDGTTLSKVMSRVASQMTCMGQVSQYPASTVPAGLYASHEGFAHSTLAGRLSIPPDDIRAAASLLMLAHPLESKVFRPRLERAGGCYGLSFGLDVALREAYLIVHRPSAPEAMNQALRDIQLADVQAVGRGLSFPALQDRALERLSGQLGALNTAISLLYNRMMGVDLYMEALRQAVAELREEEAVHHVTQTLSRIPFRTTACRPASASHALAPTQAH